MTATAREHIARCCVCCDSTDLGASPAVLMPFVAHRALGWEPVEIDASWGLKTIAQGMAYSICRSLCCRRCGLLFLDIRFSEAELAALYADYRGPEYVSLRERYEPGYAQRNAFFDNGIHYLAQVESFLQPLLPPTPRVLDWGGDTGRNTPFSGRRSLCHVYDISDKPVIGGVERIDRATLLATEYDLLVCSNVLEHAPYPRDMVLDLRAAMASHSVLYIEVPHEDVVRSHHGPGELNLRKRHWHEHINFFTRAALLSLLEGCAMEVLAMAELQITSEGRQVALFQFACRRREPATVEDTAVFSCAGPSVRM